MAFLVKSIVKKRFKAKKHQKKQVQLDRIAYDNITKLREEISLNPSKDHSSNFSRIVRQFFMGFLKIKHHFTYEEFTEDIKKKRLDPKLKNEMADFFKELSELEYKQQSYSVAELDALIRIFMSIIPRAMAEKRGRVKEKKKTKIEKIIDKLHLQDLHLPISSLKAGEKPKTSEKRRASDDAQKQDISVSDKSKISDKQKLKKKLSSQIKPKSSFDMAKLFKRKPKDNLLYVYDLIGESYNAIADKKIALASSNITEIESILPKLHTSESFEIKKDLKKLKKEMNETKKFLKDNIPLPPPKSIKISEEKKQVERKPMFTKKQPELPELIPLPDLEQPVSTKIKEKVKLEEIPLPPLPVLGLPDEQIEVKDVEIPEVKEPKKQFNLFSKEDKLKEKVKISEIKKKKMDLPPLPTAPEPETSEEQSSPDGAQKPKVSDIKEDFVVEKKEISKIKKFKLDLSEEQSSSDDAQISEGKKPSDDAQKPKVSDKSKISDKPEIEYYPDKFEQTEPSEETLKAITDSEPIVFPTAEDIDSLSLGSINKEGGSFKPKRIFVPVVDGSEQVIKPKIEEKAPEKKTTRLAKAKQVKTKPPIEELKKQEEILEKLEDLENLIMTAQQMINLRNYSEAKTTYSKALDVKKSLKLKKSDSKKIDYDLQGIDLDLKISGMT